MCGRFFLSRSGAEIAARFALAEVPAWDARFNIAPGQEVPFVRRKPEAVRARRAGPDAGDPTSRRFVRLRWGFVPRWAETAASGPRPINARAETVASSPMFRRAFAQRRGIVPADGFYEWSRGREAAPHAVRLRSGEPFAMAAIWERWEMPERAPGEAGAGASEDAAFESCAILTTRANRVVAEIHERMPVILPPEAEHAWLDPSVRDPAALRERLQPCPEEWIEMYPVERRVNSVREDDPALIEPLRDLFSRPEAT